ncbi:MULTISPECIES: hypothetical protein [unclassified Bradyrhizobium]|uniref:hypothetical protein n=1 Tax=unclassified Bradyrhizobium TaxID=2631580 RepID=UPI001CD2A01B|nr:MULTISPECIES: hypothetical protein [unclassified Bradyrhizobium]MCA1373581.1 hypothetical protein [Bradyrhizobium sp. IC4060]MCA1487224.1 hypothetical protein [Bradyrhizobium sp. IC4061]
MQKFLRGIYGVSAVGIVVFIMLMYLDVRRTTDLLFQDELIFSNTQANAVYHYSFDDLFRVALEDKLSGLYPGRGLKQEEKLRLLGLSRFIRLDYILDANNGDRLLISSRDYPNAKKGITIDRANYSFLKAATDPCLIQIRNEEITPEKSYFGKRAPKSLFHEYFPLMDPVANCALFNLAKPKSLKEMVSGLETIRNVTFFDMLRVKDHAYYIFAIKNEAVSSNLNNLVRTFFDPRMKALLASQPVYTGTIIVSPGRAITIPALSGNAEIDRNLINKDSGNVLALEMAGPDEARLYIYLTSSIDAVTLRTSAPISDRYAAALKMAFEQTNLIVDGSVAFTPASDLNKGQFLKDYFFANLRQNSVKVAGIDIRLPAAIALIAVLAILDGVSAIWNRRATASRKS